MFTFTLVSQLGVLFWLGPYSSSDQEKPGYSGPHVQVFDCDNIGFNYLKCQSRNLICVAVELG